MVFIASILSDESRREFCRDIELPAIPIKHDIIFVGGMKMEVRDKVFYDAKAIKLICLPHEVTNDKSLKKQKWSMTP